MERAGNLYLRVASAITKKGAASGAGCRGRLIRTTNLLERLFLEERHRTKIIPHAFPKRGC